MDKEELLTKVTDTVETIHHMNARLDELVAVAKSMDMDGYCLCTWQELADAMGLTRQAVQQRWRHLSWLGDGPA